MPAAGLEPITAVLPLPAGAVRLECEPQLLETARVFFPALQPGAARAATAAAFRVSRHGARWRLARDGRAVGSYASAAYALLALEQLLEELILTERGALLAIHAGAALVDGAACLAAGNAEVGKTAIGFQLAELGYPLLCEEIALVAAGGLEVRPYARSLTLDRTLIEEFERAAPLRHGRLHGLDERLRRYLPLRTAATPVRATRVLLPRFRAGGEAALEELTADAVLTEFLGYCFQPQGAGEEFLDRVIALLESCSIARLTWGDAGQARALLAGWLQGAAAAPAHHGA